MRCALLVCALGACGRFGFDALAGAGDASNTGDATDAFVDRANIVFLTRNGVSALQVATADQQCGDAATTAGLQGTFVAWVSTTTTAAIDRLAGSRGWVRVDGAPVADQPADLLGAGGLYNPIIADEKGLAVLGPGGVWTGTDDTGHLSTGGNCTDWMVTTGTTQTGEPTSTGVRFTITGANTNCTGTQRLYCFEVGHVASVPPPSQPLPANVRRVFLSTPLRHDSGPGPFDTQCTTDATGAGLPGTYLAAISTSTTSIAGRFAADARPVFRIDGTEIAANVADFFNTGMQQMSVVNQKADGTYLVSVYPTGAQNPQAVGDLTCNDWTTPNISAWMGSADCVETGRFWWMQGSATCNSTLPVLCIQQ